MARIRFLKNVTIAAMEGPVDFPTRLSFYEGETIDVNQASADRFVNIGEAEFVADEPERSGETVMEPAPEVVNDPPADDADDPDDDGDDESPSPKRRGRPPKR